MKLPQQGTGCKKDVHDEVIMHNEQLAAQLAQSHCIQWKNSEESIEKTYKYFLDKLNKGEL